MGITGTPSATRDELVARAAKLVPRLLERGQQADQIREIPRQTIDDLRQQGLLRVGNPERFGGPGLDYDASLLVTAELGRGCGSTAWCYSVWQSHNWVVGHWPLEMQEEYFALTPDTISSSAFSPSGQLQPVDGGYRLSGRWDFSSGCDPATWAFLGAMGPEGPVMLWVPRPDFQVIDTWFVSGMRGTGSKDIVVEDAFVPSHRVLAFGPLLEAQTDGWLLHGRPSYRIPLWAIMSFTLVAPLVGIARGAVECFVDYTRQRVLGILGLRAAEVESMQVRLAESWVEADLARLLMVSDLDEMLSKAARGEPFSLAERARYRRDQAFISSLCVRATNRLFEASGAHALFESHPLQRFHRDVHAGSHQIALYWDVIAQQFGRVMLGLEPSAPHWI